LQFQYLLTYVLDLASVELGDGSLLFTKNVMRDPGGSSSEKVCLQNSQGKSWSSLLRSASSPNRRASSSSSPSLLPPACLQSAIAWPLHALSSRSVMRSASKIRSGAQGSMIQSCFSISTQAASSACPVGAQSSRTRHRAMSCVPCGVPDAKHPHSLQHCQCRSPLHLQHVPEFP
jgi:hypothetical protein